MSDEGSFDEQNLINTVLFHKSKLKKIQKGGSAGKLFTKGERRKLRESHQRILSEAANIVKNKQLDIEVVTRLEEGRPSNVIVETGKEEDVDLIVMGSRGLGGITGWVLGSTSRRVVESCTKPILIIK